MRTTAISPSLLALARKVNQLSVSTTLYDHAREADMTTSEENWFRASARQAVDIHWSQEGQTVHAKPEELLRAVYDDQFEQDDLAKEWRALNEQQRDSGFGDA